MIISELLPPATNFRMLKLVAIMQFLLESHEKVV